MSVNCGFYAEEQADAHLLGEIYKVTDTLEGVCVVALLRRRIRCEEIASGAGYGGATERTYDQVCLI